MKNIIQLSVFVLLLTAVSCSEPTETQKIDFETVCNPMDISYQWSQNSPNGREGADPSIVLYKGTYFFLYGIGLDTYWPQFLWRNKLIEEKNYLKKNVTLGIWLTILKPMKSHILQVYWGR